MKLKWARSLIALMSIFSYDMITAARSGSDLVGSTASDGTGWIRHTLNNHNNAAIITPAGRCRVAAQNAESDNYLPDTPPSADYPVGIILDCLSNIAEFWNVSARSQTNTVTNEIGQFNGSSVAVYAQAIPIGGGFVQLGSTVAYIPPVGGSFLFLISPVGTTISGYLFDYTQAKWLKPDGTFQTSKIVFTSGIDSVVTAAGLPGIAIFQTGVPSDSTGCQMRGFFAGSGIVAGSATPGSFTSTTVTATASDAIGDNPPFTYQWYRSTDGTLGSPVSGKTSLTLADSGLTSGLTYYYTLRYTDASANTADSAQISFALPALIQATGYTLTPSTSTPTLNQTVTVTATLTGGNTLGSTLTITMTDSRASTISGTIVITNGSTTGTATIIPTATGTHAVAASHTGGGFVGGDGSTSLNVPLGIHVKTAMIGPSLETLIVQVADTNNVLANVATINRPAIGISGGGSSGAAAYSLVGVPKVVGGNSETWSLVIAGTTGTFTINRNIGTNPVSFNAATSTSTTASAIATALAGFYFHILPSSHPSAGDFTVTPVTVSTTTNYTIVFSGNIVTEANFDDLLLDTTGLTGGTTGTLTRTVAGSSQTFTSTADQVSGAILYNGGANYTSAPAVALTDGLGTGASLTAVVADGFVTGFTVAAGGTGYALGSYTVNGTSHPLPAPIFGAGSADANGVGNLGANPPYSANLIFPIPAVLSTDVITITLKTNWGTTAGGTILPVTNMAVTNPGRILPAPISGIKPMQVGWNLNEASTGSNVSIYSNWVKNVAGLDNSLTVVNSLGYLLPNAPNGAYTTALISINFNGIDGRGYHMPGTGNWTVKWDGTGIVDFLITSNTASITLVSSNTGHATGNSQVFAVTLASFTNAPAITLRLRPNGSNVYDFVDGSIAVYPPHVDPSNPGKFDPNILRMLAGAKSIRTLDYTHANQSNITQYTDYPSPQQFSLLGTKSNGVIAIQSIGPYTNGSPFGFNNNNVFFVVNFATNHPFVSGQLIQIVMNNDGGPHGNGTYDLAGGGTIHVGVGFPWFSTVAFVKSATQIVVSSNMNGTTDTLATTYTAAASQLGTGSPICQVPISLTGIPTDAAELCNAIQSDLWFNVPHAMTDAGCTALATALANTLDTNLKLRVEYSNEHWNFGGGFAQSTYFVVAATALGMVNTVTVANVGSGYTHATITFVGGSPTTPATATAIISGGQIRGVTFTNYGFQYQTIPTVSIVGDGTGAVITIPFLNSGSNSLFYAYRAAQVHQLFRDAFVAAGRPATDVIRVMGGQGGFPGGPGSTVALYCQVHGKQFEEMCVAPYFENCNNNFGSGETSIQLVVEATTDDQNADFSDLNIIENSEGPLLIAPVKTMLTSFGFSNVDVVCYEGGPGFGFFGAFGPAINARNVRIIGRSLAWTLNPRYYANHTYYLQSLSDSGCKLINIYTSFGTNDLFQGVTWCAYRGYNMLAGKGDGSDGLFDNRTNYNDFANQVCVVGKAMIDWQGTGSEGGTSLGAPIGSRYLPWLMGFLIDVTPTIEPPATLQEAIFAYWEQAGLDTVVCPYFEHKAPSAFPYPYIVLRHIEELLPGETLEDRCVDAFFTIFAASPLGSTNKGAVQAKQLGALMHQYFGSGNDGGNNGGGLTWATGSENTRVRNGASPGIRPSFGAGNLRVFTYDINYQFWIRGEP